jgi:8-amino-7-oxononanoate synthase
LFDLLAHEGIAVFLDAKAYPIACWGAEHAALRGVKVRRFPHHQPQALRRLVAAESAGRKRPVIVTDGYCPDCGRLAPLEEYAAIARRESGFLVVDDTQALGILGEQPAPRMPYGHGGGGSLRHAGIRWPELVLVSSLAKGFGVPLAVLAGSTSFIHHFEDNSRTRMHCSPPSMPAVQAAHHALEVNQRHGEALRHRLIGNLRRFRRGVEGLGLTVNGGLFPVQTLELPDRLDAETAQRQLGERGVQTVLRRGRASRPEIAFILTARHCSEDIDRAVQILGEQLGRLAASTPGKGVRDAQLDGHRT